MISKRALDRVAATIAVVAFVLGLTPFWLGGYDPGIRLAVDERTSGGRLVVAAVDPYSTAARDGVQPGMVVVGLNGQELISLPTEIYAESSGDPGGEVIGLSPATPTNLLDVGSLHSLALQPVQSLSLVSPDALENGGAEAQYAVSGFWYPGWDRLQSSGQAILIGLAVLITGAWWLMSGRAGASLQDLAFPLSTAAATPLLVLPLYASGSAGQEVLAGLIGVVAMLPLAAALVDRIDHPADRRFGVIAAILFSGAAVAFAYLAVFTLGSQPVWPIFVAFATGAIPFVPGALAAGPLIRSARSSGRGAARLLQSAEFAVAGLTPFFTLIADRSTFLWPLVGWLAALAVASRFTVRPLARLATRATLQRDLVVAAAEAERARLAADIHDDALQELTLLVRRLESSGDTEGAEIGRTVADKLRAICGDLRLPILDDLGVGPALDWLVLRIERLAGGEVRLERADDARHAPDVELAIFRVAQEALANAVKHGKPPIVVRYRSTPGGISLAVDDAGPGIADDAPETAEQSGRLGLLNMAQRAEQIGAILDVKRWPGGGTHVALEWRPR
ncbi:MAG TPA: ATP-binding protein [Candidatus Limnocylindrales bacterium]|nr:ATP-binding protein [Candidatus Limnocylindrales bacterium]